MITLEALQVKILKDIGEINSRRTDLLTKLLSKYYKDVDAMDDALFFYTVNEESRDKDEEETEFSEGLVITPKSINFLLSKDEKIQLHDVKEILNEIFEALLLEPTDMKLISEMVLITNVETKALAHSLNNISEKAKFDDVQGASIRLMINNDKFKGEFAIEPLIRRKDSEFYSNYKVRFKDTVELEHLTDEIIQVKEDAERRIKQVLLN
jgi:hypothetical protein